MPDTSFISDPRLDFLDLISLEKSHVLFDPPLILLFGGDMTKEYGSFRERLNHFTITRPELAESIRSPENFTGWLHDARYKDLLEFEFDLAHLSTYIVIILETAGSIAELGSFAVNPSFSNKVIVVIEDEHYDNESFINLGPLRKFNVENIIVSSASFLRPKEHTLNQMTNQTYMSRSEYEESLNSVIEHLENLISKKDNSKKEFIHDDIGHLSFLVYEMVNMFLALKPIEIRTYLTKLGINIEKKKLDDILYLLRELELLTRKKVGREFYYFCLSPEISRFKFSSKPEKSQFDRTIIPINTSRFYRENPKEALRVRLIKNHHIGITE